MNISTSANSSKPKPLNLSRYQTSQKVLTKELDRAPLPLSHQVSAKPTVTGQTKASTIKQQKSPALPLGSGRLVTGNQIMRL